MLSHLVVLNVLPAVRCLALVSIKSKLTVLIHRIGTIYFSLLILDVLSHKNAQRHFDFSVIRDISSLTN
jgi:hypothetical protein